MVNLPVVNVHGPLTCVQPLARSIRPCHTGSRYERPSTLLLYRCRRSWQDVQHLQYQPTITHTHASHLYCRISLGSESRIYEIGNTRFLDWKETPLALFTCNGCGSLCPFGKIFLW